MHGIRLSAIFTNQLLQHPLYFVAHQDHSKKGYSKGKILLPGDGGRWEWGKVGVEMEEAICTYL